MGRQKIDNADKAVEKNRATMSAEEADKDLRHKFATMLREVRRAFVFYDKQNEGVLDHAHFRDAVRFLNMKLNDAQWKRLMKMYDPQGNGINFREIKLKFDKEAAGGYDKSIANVMHMNAAKELQKINDAAATGSQAMALTAQEVHNELKHRFSIASKKMKRLFKIIDSDGSGVIDHAEFSQCLKNLNLFTSPAEFKKLMLRYDPDQNGITFREFSLM